MDGIDNTHTHTHTHTHKASQLLWTKNVLRFHLNVDSCCLAKYARKYTKWKRLGGREAGGRGLVT